MLAIEINKDDFYKNLKTGYTVLFCKKHNGEECLISLPNNWLFCKDNLSVEYAPHDSKFTYYIDLNNDKTIPENYEVKFNKPLEFEYEDDILYCEKMKCCDDIWSTIKQYYKEKYNKEMPCKANYTDINGVTRTIKI